MPVELVLIEGISREEARQRYECGDVFVDQLLIGWYGSFGVEAMALGRPVLCYIRDSDLRFVPAEMAAELPIVRTTSLTLADDLRRVVLDAALRRDLGERGRAYVEKWHDPLKIAGRLATLYAGLGSGRRGARSAGRPEARS
jgi:glycosyltransferase involved in cell wall biosynthesis